MNTSCDHGYDTLGQLEHGRHNWQEQPGEQPQPIPGQQFSYVFDHIGNRTQTTTGESVPEREADYTPNKLNQYEHREVPGYVDVLGLAVVSSPVTVKNKQNNNTYSAGRAGEYFYQAVPVNNSGGGVQVEIVVSQAGSPDVPGTAFVPAALEGFDYDEDGNLKSDGRWNYTWDAENRLIKMVSHAGPARMLRFDYDWMGRRIRKRVWQTLNETDPATATRFVYDGWNLLVELDEANAVKRSYVWGTDLSGTFQGAGGVGGLLTVTDSTGSYSCAYDGNGNLVGLVNTADGKIAAQYEYGPFGELIRATGPMAKANPFRFSTKYQDGETDLLYYGYRYYSANVGRWLSRDPIEEKGGLNLFRFAENSPTSRIDINGREVGSICPNCGTYYVGECGCGYPNQAVVLGTKTKVRWCKRCIDDRGEKFAMRCAIKCANAIHGHDYADYGQDFFGDRIGVGLFDDQKKAGELPDDETKLNVLPPYKCRDCYRISGRTLEEGSYAGAGKRTEQATDDEIYNCIKSHKLRHNYHTVGYNCTDWMSDAMASCGVSCDSSASPWVDQK